MIRMSLKGQLAWMIKGAQRTDAAMQRLGNDLRELQLKVEAVSGRVDLVDAQLAAGVGAADVERIEGAIAAMRTQLRSVTDDLGDRVGALSASIQAPR